MTKTILVFFFTLMILIMGFTGIYLSLEERTNMDAALIQAKNPGCKFEKMGSRRLSPVWLIKCPSNTVEAIVKNGDIVVTREFFTKDRK